VRGDLKTCQWHHCAVSDKPGPKKRVGQRRVFAGCNKIQFCLSKCRILVFPLFQTLIKKYHYLSGRLIGRLPKRDFDLLSGNQAAAYISLQEIQKELKLRGDLDARVAERLEKNKVEIEKWLAEGMAAMKDKDYASAVQYLEKVAEQAPLATVRQNLAFAYEQLGNTAKAQENLGEAKKIDPTIQTGKSYAQMKTRNFPFQKLRLNILNLSYCAHMAGALGIRMALKFNFGGN